MLLNSHSSIAQRQAAHHRRRNVKGLPEDDRYRRLHILHQLETYGSGGAQTLQPAAGRRDAGIPRSEDQCRAGDGQTDARSRYRSGK